MKEQAITFGSEDKVNVIGIATWGIVDRKDTLIGKVGQNYCSSILNYKPKLRGPKRNPMETCPGRKAGFCSGPNKSSFNAVTADFCGPSATRVYRGFTRYHFTIVVKIISLEQYLTGKMLTLKPEFYVKSTQNI